jgi:hypothetical protein
MIPDRRLADFLELPERLPTSSGRTTLFIRISPLYTIQMADTHADRSAAKFRVVHHRPGNLFY